MRWKSEPSASTIATCAPPFTGSTGFLLPISKSRKELNSPTPTRICFPSGDHDGARISPFRVRMDFGDPCESRTKRSAEPSAALYVTAKCSPLRSYAGRYAVPFISKSLFRLHCFIRKDEYLNPKRVYTTCLPSGDQDGVRKLSP